jgi:hypothetical protein
VFEPRNSHSENAQLELDPEGGSTPPLQARTRPMQAGVTIRAAIASVAVYLASLALAVLVPVLVAGSLMRRLTFLHTTDVAIPLESALNVAAGVVLGYSAYKQWRRAQMKWVRVPGAIWFMGGVVRALFQPSSVLDGLEVYATPLREHQHGGTELNHDVERLLDSILSHPLFLSWSHAQLPEAVSRLRAQSLASSAPCWYMTARAIRRKLSAIHP